MGIAFAVVVVVVSDIIIFLVDDCRIHCRSLRRLFRVLIRH